jgi:hypothetical protein
MSGIVAGINAGIALTSMGISMSQKKKAEGKAMEAEREAELAMTEARERLSVNYQEGRTISKDPYTMALEQSLAQGAASVEAAQEGGARGVAQVGRIQMAQNQMAEGQRVGYGQELQQLDKDIRNEDSRLRDINTQIDLQEVEGAQQAAAMYDEQAAAAKAAAVESGINAVQAGIQVAPDYMNKMGSTKQAYGKLASEGYQGGQMAKDIGFTPDYNILAGLGADGNRGARQYMRGLSQQQQNAITFDPAFSALFPVKQ